jgi:predicted translin family RNA/ssDNA-binding protein
MTSPPSSQNIRLTITVTPEVHEAFQRFAKAAGMSLGRAMGEWLGDTVEAAEFTATKMEQARAAPKVVMREMHAYALGLADETGQLMNTLREKGRAERSGAARASIPPSGNTGGNLNESKHKRQGGKS